MVGMKEISRFNVAHNLLAIAGTTWLENMPKFRKFNEAVAHKPRQQKKNLWLFTCHCIPALKTPRNRTQRRRRCSSSQLPHLINYFSIRLVIEMKIQQSLLISTVAQLFIYGPNENSISPEFICLYGMNFNSKVT